jgi:hypothetical protein
VKNEQNPFALSPEQIAALQAQQAGAAKQTKPAKKLKLEFTLLPYERVMEAANLVNNVQLLVLFALVHVNFKTHENPVTLSTAVFRQLGIRLHPSSKTRALKAWSKTGLITVRFRKNRSPLVTLNWLS